MSDIDLGLKMISRLGDNIPVTMLIKFRYFIGFRILIYCDECHDFLGSRTVWNNYTKNLFYTGKKTQLYEDIQWYINELVNQEGRGSEQQIKRDPFYIQFNNEKLISWCRALGKHTNQDDFISDDKIAKRVASYIITYVFAITPLPLSKLLKCGVDFDIYKVASVLTSLNRERWADNAPLSLCVDMTIKGRNLVPFYNVIFKDYFKRKAINECNENPGSIQALLRDGWQLTEPGIEGSRIKFIQTPAQKFDAAGTDTIEKLLNVDPTNNIIDFTAEPELLSGIVSFFGIPIIEYRFTPQTDDINLEIGRFFSIPRLGGPVSSKNSSVSKIAEGISLGGQTLPQDRLSLTAFKTMGDFLQIVSSIVIKDSVNFGFITGDILCGKIASLFIKNTFCEVDIPDDPYGGISIYLSAAQRSLFINLNPEIAAILQEILTITPVGNYMLESLEEQLPGSADLTDFAEAFDQVAQTSGSESWFGKKKKVSIRNTSTKVLKAKLKLVGIPLSKVIRGKRMKLTRKQLEMRAEAFKKLQMRCQKRGISLTYVSKKGRKYKSVKRLLNDMKRKPKTKTKPKTKKKSKMKWG